MAKQKEKKKEKSGPADDETGVPEDELVISKHTITIHGLTVHYTATAGRIVLKEEKEKKKKSAGEKARASIFFVAYTRDDIQDLENRPVTFSFNVGPGSSSVWMHLGLLGPRRVLLDEDGRPGSPPYRLENNEFSLLDITDLVFIDPVSTGYSRAIAGEKPGEFHEFKKDIESVGDFIRLFTSRYQRWGSPKFLIGESYGTTRAAGLAGYLQDRHGLYLNGLLLISSVLNFQTIRISSGNDLPFILFLPTFAATAWYHGRLPADLQQELPQTLAEVRAFALGEYALALLQGDDLPAAEREQIVQKLARYTALEPDYIKRSNLRINIFRYVKELLRDQRRTVGRLDSRFKGYDRDAAGEQVEYDPSHALLMGVFSATFNDYIRGELLFESDLPYEILANLWASWRYEEHQNEYVDVSETLRKAMSQNPNLKVIMANGYYDLATPYLATEYTVSHMQLEPELRGNISLTYYESGHMMYIHRPSLAALKNDLAKFIIAATASD
jgi:carboxypeptidase C (cathepsin A)